MLDAEALAAMLAPIISEEVEKAVTPLNARIAELEARKPEPGPPGEKGEKGENGDAGERGADGQNGADGRGVKALLIDREGQLIATMDDGEMKELGPVIGKDGRDGTDGKNAEVSEDWGDGLSTDEKTGMVSAMLRKELGDEDLIILPEPVVVPSAAPSQSPLVIHNHLPKRGIERTVVTKHDERGRIAEYERHEV